MISLTFFMGSIITNFNDALMKISAYFEENCTLIDQGDWYDPHIRGNTGSPFLRGAG
jgi:hypothetical protein